MKRIPHLCIVVCFCLIAVAGYLGFSVWVLGWADEPALRGDVVGTWKSFAVAAFSFWVGSSSGGKATAATPQPVTVTNDPANPVPVEQNP